MIYKGENNYIIITINKCKRPTIIRGELEWIREDQSGWWSGRGCGEATWCQIGVV